jgi:hypothetical protein
MKKKKPTPSKNPVISGFELLRDPNITWYGPHQCGGCGKTIIKTSTNGPQLVLDADDHNHHYPNHRWMEHVCSGATMKGK